MLRVRVSNTKGKERRGWGSEVSLLPCFCAEVLLVPGGAGLPHLRVLWHVCQWVRADNVPVKTKSP